MTPFAFMWPIMPHLFLGNQVPALLFLKFLSVLAYCSLSLISKDLPLFKSSIFVDLQQHLVVENGKPRLVVGAAQIKHCHGAPAYLAHP